MIKINDTFSIYKDNYNWVLVEHTQGINIRTGKEGEGQKKSFHPTFDQAMRHAAEQSSQDVESFEELEGRYLKLMADIKDLAVSVGEVVAECPEVDKVA